MNKSDVAELLLQKKPAVVSYRIRHMIDNYRCIDETAACFMRYGYLHDNVLYAHTTPFAMTCIAVEDILSIELIK